ncbi:hypothetical protein [Chitinophaga sp. YIM B06452]|uniref:hypothetical protein n=1 Tax=Chitinophaga sp. YIM B06452 TaxID=3082158 RepID=UPI0031FEF995
MDTLAKITGRREKILWEQAIVYRLQNSTVYQMPVASTNPRVYNIRLKNSPLQRIDEIQKQVGHNFIIFNRFDNGGFELLRMTVQPDERYTLGQSTNEKFKYRKMDTAFSGMVFYHSIKDEFMGGWQFERGKAIKKVRYIEHDPNGKIVTCTNVTIDYYCQTCNDYYTNGVYTGSSCGGWTYCGPAGELFFCTVEEEPGDPSGGGGPTLGPIGWRGWAAGSNLCGNINYFPMAKVGNSWTGQINFVRPRFVFESTSWVDRRDIPLSFANVCVTLPEYGLFNSSMASEAFRLLHNSAIEETLLRLSLLPQPPPPTPLIDAIVRETFQETFDELMRNFNPKARITSGPCIGTGIPQSEPVYGGNCN